MPTNLDMICNLLFRALGRSDKLVFNKLLYLIQAYTLVKDGIPAFESPIEAWMYGPVVPEVYFNMKRNSNHYENIENVNLNQDIRENVEEIIKIYREIPPFVLVELTHTYDTWKNTWNNGEGRNRIIDVEDIYNYHFEKSKNEDGRLF